MVGRLPDMQSLETDIRVAVVGIGSIGNGLVFQSTLTPGIRVVAVADTRIQRAIHCAEWLNVAHEVVDSLGAMHDCIAHGKLAVCDSGKILAQCDAVDVFLEATSSIAAGGDHALTALRHGQHVVMMNYEADLMFGPLLLSEAQKHGLVYTGCDGDQPSVVKRLIDDLIFWGFDLVMAGNIKGYLDRYANPTTIVPEADKRNLDYQMCTSYTDGTKLSVEMAVVANSLGLRTAVPGMSGPRCGHVREVFEVFDFDALWNNGQGVVDYVLGAQPTGGVFAVGYTEHEFQQFTLDWFPPRMGPGPFYLFYRPYHLGHIEAMASIADAVLEGKAVIQPRAGFQTNVYAYAKQDLQPGTVLDGVGGYSCYGLVENCVGQNQHPGLPICLAQDVVLKRSVPRDGRVLLADTVYDPLRPDFALYGKSIDLVSGGAARVEMGPKRQGGLG